MSIVFKSGSLNLLEPSGLVQACNGTAVPLNYLKYWHEGCATVCDASHSATWTRIFRFIFYSVCRMMMRFVKGPSASFPSWCQIQYFAKKLSLEHFPGNASPVFVIWGLFFLFYFFSSSGTKSDLNLMCGWKHIRFSVDKKNQLDVTFCILYFSSNSCSTCFGQPCAHHQ